MEEKLVNNVSFSFNERTQQQQAPIASTTTMEYQQQQEEEQYLHEKEELVQEEEYEEEYGDNMVSMEMVISSQDGDYKEEIGFDGIVGIVGIVGNDRGGDGNNNRWSRKVDYVGKVVSNNGETKEIIMGYESFGDKGNNEELTIKEADQTSQAIHITITSPNPLSTTTIKPPTTHTAFESEQRLYEEYQHDNNESESSDSESSLDTEASFAKMNARRTMLLSDDFYGNNHYSTIIDQLSTEQCKTIQESTKRIAHLQSLIKRESILLEFEEKTKTERIKEIEYSYVNAFNNFLFLRNVKCHSMANSTNPILLNSKDLFQLHEEFLDDLRRVKDVLGRVVFGKDKEENSGEGAFVKSLSSYKYTKHISNNYHEDITSEQLTLKWLFTPSSKSSNNDLSSPPESFLIDLHNFFPSWAYHIRQFMQIEFESHEKIENTFESEYTLPSKIISSIRYKDSVHRFCEIIFKKPIEELKKVKTELIIDFASIYEKWTTQLFNIPNSNPLKQFMEGRYLLEESTSTAIVQEISKFFGEKMDQNEYYKLLVELNHFSKNRNAMNFLFSEIGSEEIEGEQINLRLALLVHKKMQINRRKLQQLSLLFINQIIENYEDIPVEIKYVVQVFKEFAKKKLQDQGLEPLIKYEDLKSFFNKIIFSQLFFTIFMQLLEDGQTSNNPKSPASSIPPKQSQAHNKSFASDHENHNITMIALISQKIMFGQEFYEKFKYGYFNTVIKEYNLKIKSFIENFAETEVIRFEGKKEIECMLVSLETVKYLYEVLKNKGLIRELVSFEKKLMSCKHNEPFSLGSSRYTPEKMYTMIVYKPEFNYTSIFRPKEKFRRTFIEFLTMIESINDGVTFKEVLEQYKCMEEDHLEISKPSIQIYANYLESFEQRIETEDIVSEIEQDIIKTKSYIEKVKISLEREHNLSMNMEYLYRYLLMETKKANSKETLEDYINLLFNLPLEFDYFVIDGKICENESTSGKKKERVIKDCLNDVAAYFGKGLEGLDALYSLLLEKIVDQIEKQGVVDENMIESAQIIIGEKLYNMINLPVLQSEKDKRLYNSMRRHRFLNLKMLSLPQYIDEEEIILDMSLEILEKFKHPMSPDKMIECFNEVTLVFQNVITCVGKASDITSDVQIPLMELILVKSMIPNLDTILLFIKTFSHNENGSNKYGMIIALVESICYLIENMDAQHLGISESEYVGYVENEYLIVDEKY